MSTGSLTTGEFHTIELNTGIGHVEEGGYWTIGKLVIVNCRIAISGTLSGFTELSIGSLPVPATPLSSDNTYIRAGNNKFVEMDITEKSGLGLLFLPASPGISGVLIISAVYIAR